MPAFLRIYNLGTVLFHFKDISRTIFHAGAALDTTIIKYWGHVSLLSGYYSDAILQRFTKGDFLFAILLPDF
jgi:hypothetical protein